MRRVLPWARRSRRVVVVFDGPEDLDLARGYGGLRVVWSGSRSADGVIRALIRDRPADWTVVTDDVDLAAACRRTGARHRPVGDFLAGIPREGSEPVEEVVDVGDWQAWFERGGSD